MPTTNLLSAERGATHSADSLDRLNKHARQRGETNERDALASRAMSRRAFNAVLNTACSRHGARAGAGCWTIERDGATPTLGLCSSRIGVVFTGGGVR